MARRFGWMTALLAVALAWAGTAGAGDAPSGIGELRWKSSTRQILEIDGRDYRVTGQTVIRDLEGRWISRGQLDAPRSDAVMVPLKDVVMGAYEAAEERGRRVLRRVRVIETQH